MRLASSIIAHSSPSASTPWAASRAGRPVRLVAELLEPERVASRRAGSIVTTATFSAALGQPQRERGRVVVLPTPPEPAQMTIRFPSSSDSTEVIALTSAQGHPDQRTRGDILAGPGAARRRAPDQAFADRERHGLRAAARVELGDDVVQDVLHGAFGVAELLGDLPCRVPGRDQRQHLLLAVGERGLVRAAVAVGAVGAAHQPAEQLGGDDAGAAWRRPDGGGEPLHRQRVLAQDPDRARLHRREHAVLRAVGRAHEHARARRLGHRADEVAAARHRVVEHHEVGARTAPGISHASRTDSASATRFDAVQLLEAGREAAPIDRMGVQDEQLQLRSALSDVCIRA